MNSGGVFPDAQRSQKGDISLLANGVSLSAGFADVTQCTVATTLWGNHFGCRQQRPSPNSARSVCMLGGRRGTARASSISSSARADNCTRYFISIFRR